MTLSDVNCEVKLLDCTVLFQASGALVDYRDAVRFSGEEIEQISVMFPKQEVSSFRLEPEESQIICGLFEGAEVYISMGKDLFLKPIQRFESFANFQRFVREYERDHD